MSLPVRFPMRWLAVVLALLVVASNASPTQAGLPASPSPYDESQTAPPEGVLPDGVEWNRPLKAGEMALPRAPQKQTKPTSLTKKEETQVGDLQAPQIKSSAAQPLLTAEPVSSANVMLMEGMKNALTSAGQSTSASSSAITAVPMNEPETPVAENTLKPPQLKAEAETAKESETASSVKYQPGQEPKDLASLMPADEPASETPAAESSAPLAESASTEEPAKPAESMSEESPKTEEPAAASAEKTSADSSIFGAPVDETAKDEPLTMADAGSSMETPPPPAAAEEKREPACEPKTVSWTKTCAEAGYDESFSGKIVGESRTECPSGATKDVWLSNSCTPPATAEAGPRATDLTEAPKELTEIAAAESAPSKESEPVAPVTIPAPAPEQPARVDANCGAANGLASTARPADDLCLSGSSTDVSGEGPWRWSCKGANGGMTVSCAAPLAKATATKKAVAESPADETKVASNAPVLEDGKCGPADGSGFDAAPATDLCAKGTPSRVNGGGPWTWACSGSNGGQAAACAAQRKIDGACGSANDNGVDSMPTRDLCTTGYASAVTGEGPWSWTCSGLYGGGAATCQASPKVNAICGTASLQGHREAPKEDLCKSGEATTVAGDGPWSWTCAGGNGGTEVACKAPVLVDGACGSAHGGSFDKAPENDLCANGHPSRVTGLGPWSWNCLGNDGGNAASCTASLGAAKETPAASEGAICGAAAEMAALQAPSQNLCNAGKAGDVSGNGPWTWTCADDNGHSASCSTLVAVEGACGTAANVPSAKEPADNLCASGQSSVVTADKSNWTWGCLGSSESGNVSCSAPLIAETAATPAAKASTASADARCGKATERGMSAAPTADLCAAGKPSSVRGSGPWHWTCGAKAKQKVKCETPLLVDGVCGSANGSIQINAPSSGLCLTGTPTTTEGTGPWLWSCVGIGGGSSVSCSAAAQSQTRVDGACGAAANAVMTQTPDANLCDSGVPSQVHGEGPWTWTCSGLNGGIASTCTTSRVMPKAPPPPGPPVNGLCGPSNGVAAIAQPSEGLCSSGTATSISGNGPWNWNCLGANGGMTVSCTAPLMPPAPIVGVCGPANGVTTATMPKGGLCSAGISSAVSGKGPWTWSCSGTNGGGAVSCVAPLAGTGKGVSSGIPSMVTPSSGDTGVEAPTPRSAPVGLVTPTLPAGPLPPLESGTLPELTPSKPLDLPTEPSAAGVPMAPYAIPATTPELPKGTEPLMPPPLRDTTAPTPGLQPPVIDAEGKPVPGARLVLDPEIATLNFVHGSDALDTDMTASLDKLANILAMNGKARITLNAYAGTGDASSRDARRLSLARALAIRDYLTTKGISSSRIDVRALGANVPSGDMDRVDVKVN